MINNYYPILSTANNMGTNELKDIVLRPIINLIPFPLIKRFECYKYLIFYSHLVNDKDVPHIKHLYKYKSTKQFINDLEFLLKHFSPIGLLDIIRCKITGNILPRNCFHLTFDDGLREIYDVIAPILLEKGVPATFFISSAFLDNRILCYQHKASLLVENISKGLLANTEKRIKEILVNNGFQYSQICEGILKIDYQRKNILDQIAEIVQINFQEYLNEKQPYLTSLQVKKVVNQGFTIGAHSIDHPYYSDLPLAKQLEQTIGSVRHIRQQFGLDYGAFAFPHNDTGVTHAFFSKIQECGFIDITFGTGGLIESDMKNHLQRISMEKPVMHAKKLIVWQYIRRLYMQLKRKLD